MSTDPVLLGSSAMTALIAFLQFVAAVVVLVKLKGSGCLAGLALVGLSLLGMVASCAGPAGLGAEPWWGTVSTVMGVLSIVAWLMVVAGVASAGRAGSEF